MSHNEPLANHQEPEWVWEIVEKHDLALRAGFPRAAVTVLLTDAADHLQKIAATIREQALTPNAKEHLSEVIDMLGDAERLSAICAEE